ncbi:D-alanyl-D-alanine carboxypeptidase/D-alanyl-D-alanine-endopeptidase [Janthinobacterium fluminis]|uniref:D-alanyl-D-alanine carboxypeptidase/D-alanyl-D-alanine-endopeptidase n=1 Tax=Janthinobacterium fluminis TaxID=2987524 RepID=A0ABT5JZ03_9BURK|nr:D-alanyl-D-alanine carboxypeptidase/D-alanyl-D-alanine-endopeptidase [Janthinobacterium fluminis]MDC8757952.1 D-alanyl-D-alanine carboxypeptidase/D-alanyl-D-alanine-endopeptidase [Janthinobacterium fluminis]
MLRRATFAALLACSAAAHAELPEPVARLLRAANIPDEAVGAVVLRGNATVLAHGAERSMQPASTMKLVTTLVGLEQLGPIFRGRTELRSGADLVGGVLQGDLVLRGGGDADFDADVLEHMLQKLRNQGVKKIKGDLLLDRQLFRPARPDRVTPQFDRMPEFRYNVVPDALLLNTNMLQIDISSTQQQLKLLMMPPLEGVSVGADMKLVDAPCAKWEDGWRTPDYVRGEDGKLKVLLHGSFPRNCAHTVHVNVLDRQDYADRLFRATWRRLGGSFGGAVREAATPAGTRLLADHVARALPEVLRDINKISDNTQARLLYLSLGSLESDAYFGSRPLAAGDADTAVRARQVVRDWFLRHRIDEADLVIENGSGLSRTERIRPAQLAAVLRVGSQSVWAPEFLSSLPIAALDGTMRRRLRDSAAAARARIKTGGLENVVAIAGYVPDANNEQCVVVAFINHERVGNGAGRAALDALIDWVAASGLPPA